MTFRGIGIHNFNRFGFLYWKRGVQESLERGFLTILWYCGETQPLVGCLCQLSRRDLINVGQKTLWLTPFMAALSIFGVIHYCNIQVIDGVGGLAAITMILNKEGYCYR